MAASRTLTGCGYLNGQIICIIEDGFADSAGTGFTVMRNMPGAVFGRVIYRSRRVFLRFGFPSAMIIKLVVSTAYKQPAFPARLTLVTASELSRAFIQTVFVRTPKGRLFFSMNHHIGVYGGDFIPPLLIFFFIYFLHVDL
jgi:hypothetical protein